MLTTVVQAITKNPTYLVIGKNCTAQTLDKFKSQGAVVISEADFLDLILRPQPSTPAPQLGTKRSTEEPETQPPPKIKKSKTAKGKKKEEEETMEQMKRFLANKQSEVRLTGRTLEAFHHGGSVKKIQGGKSYVGMLQRFDDWLASCNGVSTFVNFHAMQNTYIWLFSLRTIIICDALNDPDEVGTMDAWFFFFP